tara:strand:+ start:117 stop:899 length:783 start_codon:yes stop_codon:yes gene_type:complete
MSFVCECCNFYGKTKQQYQRHLDTSKHKDVIAKKRTGALYDTISTNATNGELEILRHLCLSLQIENQNLKSDIRNIVERLNIIEKNPVSYTDNSTNKQTYNINQNINITFDRKTFQNEDAGAFGENPKKFIIKDKAGSIANLVKALHFNDKYPQNRNIRMDSRKSGCIEMNDATDKGQEWVNKPKKQALEEIALNATHQFKDRVEETGDLSAVMEDALKKMTGPIIDPQHENHKTSMKTECKHIESILLTEKNSGRNPSS